MSHYNNNNNIAFFPKQVGVGYIKDACHTTTMHVTLYQKKNLRVQKYIILLNS